MKKSLFKNKKTAILVALVLLISGIISFSPYTITRLITQASDATDILNENPEYMRLQAELDQTTLEEQQKLAEVVVIDQKVSEKEVAIAEAPAFDEATAPAVITLKVQMAETKKAPQFPVTVSFVAVGDKRYDVVADKDGTVSIELTSGRYYTEITLGDVGYKLVGDGPAFFANANEEKDLGVMYITKK